MTNEELITKARECARELHETDPEIAEPDTLTEVRLRETVTIDLSHPNATSVQVIMDRHTGEVITASYWASQPQPNEE